MIGIKIQITRGGKPTESAGAGVRRTRKLVATFLVLGVIGVFAGVGSYSAFTATTGNTGNSFTAGTVAISDNDGGTAMLALPNAKPTDSDTSCIRVTYTGSLASSVRLYGSVSGSMPQYMTLTVTRGTDSSPSYDSCSNFSADATNYLGLGNGVIYQGALSSFPADYPSGIVDPLSGSPESWTTNEAHSYRFVVTLNNNTAAQGTSGSASFTWEAQNQ